MQEVQEATSARRTAALDLACRVVPEGDSTGHYLSTARQFDRYICSGLSQVGPSRTERLVAGVEGILVEVDKKRFTPDEAQAVETAVHAAIEGALR